METVPKDDKSSGSEHAPCGGKDMKEVAGECLVGSFDQQS